MMQSYSVDKNTYVKLLDLSDADALFDLVVKNRDHLGKWLQFAHKTKSIEDTRQFIAKSLYQFATNNGYWTGIWHNGKLAGAIGFLYFNWDDKLTEIGYYLAAEFEGKGIMTKTCKTFIENAFYQLGLNRVEIKIASENVKSRNVMRRIGAKEEGTLRQAEWFIDRYVDKVVYGVLKEEWNLMQQRTKNEV